MWKLALAAVAVAVATMFSQGMLALPDYHPAVLVLPAVAIVFLAGLVLSQR
ncbi:MAG: hypothetical protein AB7E80_09735 [Hyphomicrobiaceae bacterium]